MGETHKRDNAKDKNDARPFEPPSGEPFGMMEPFELAGGIDEWLELIESQIAERLNAKAGRTIYNLSGANVGTHSLDCAHCLTDYAH